MRIFRVLALIGIVACPAVALAQDPPPPTHEQKFEAAYVGVTGNSSSRTIGAGFDLLSRPAPWLVRNRLAFVRNEADDEVSTNSLDFISRVQRSVNARTSVFGEYAFFRDRFAGVSSRNTGTGGVVLVVRDDAVQRLTVDLGLGYTHETRIDDDDISSASYMAGASYRLKVSDAAELTEDLRLSGIFADNRNWRVENGLALTTTITGGLSLKASYLIRYAHLPPPGYRRTDAIVSIALVAAFSQP